MIDLKRTSDETRPGTMRQETAIAAAPIVAACCLVNSTDIARQSAVCKSSEEPMHGPVLNKVVLLRKKQVEACLLGMMGGIG